MSLAYVKSREGGSLAGRAVAYIRGLIAEGNVGPGDRLNELEIATSLGISRGPVREAIQRLASSGLLIFEPNIGSRVVSIDENAVRQLYEVREALESLAAGLAARRMTQADKDALTATLDQHESQMDDANSNAYPHSSDDWDFHFRIISASGNSHIWRICGDELRDQINLLRRRHAVKAGRGRRALQEHRWIADAIIAGHGDLASLLMSQHIRASRDNLLSTLPD
jgi:DNA-binding GntR family transcriptional regulator